MKDDIQDELQRIYSTLRNRLSLKRKLKDNSVLVSIINVKSNEAYKLLSESGVNQMSIPHEIFEYLLSSEFIRMAERPEKYVLTVKGIWEVESRGGVISTDLLLERIDRKFFDVFLEGGQLNEKEKIILLTMIAVRSFSEEAALDLKRGDAVLVHLQALLEQSYRFLSQHGFITNLKLRDLFGAQGNEHPVSHLIRHTDGLLKRTRGIYKTAGKQRYFLDVFDGARLSEDAIMSLFGSIFGSAMTLGQKNELGEFCLNTAYAESPYLFDLTAKHFANPTYDEQFEEALEKYYASKYKWDAEDA